MNVIETQKQIVIIERARTIMLTFGYDFIVFRNKIRKCIFKKIIMKPIEKYSLLTY